MAQERLDVHVRLRGLRQFLSSASRAGLAASGIGSAWMVMSRRMSISQGLMIRGFSALHRQIRGISIVAGVAGFALGKEIIDFEGQMKRVQSVTETSTGKAAVAYDDLVSSAIDAASQTKFSNTQSAEALYILAAAGFEAKDAQDALLGTLRLAQAVGVNSASAAHLQTSALNAFRDAGYTATDVADLMTRAVNRSALSADNLVQSFKYVAQPAAQLGFSLEDTTAALMTLAQVGLKGSQAGTSLRFGMKSLISPVGQAKTAMKEMNLTIEDFQDGAGGMKEFPQIIQTIRDATKDMTKVERQATIGRLVGVRAMNAWSELVENSGTYDKMTKRIRDQGLTAEQTGERMQQNIGSSLENMGNQVSGFFIKFLLRYSPAIQMFFRRIGNSFENFGKKIPMIEAFLRPFWEAFVEMMKLAWTIGKDVLLVIAVGLVLIRTLLIGITPVIAFVNEHWWIFRGLLIGIGIIMGALFIVRIAKSAIFAIKFAIAIVKVTKAIFLARGAMAALTFMFMTNPITIWIVAIGLLIGILISAYMKFKWFRNGVNAVLNFIKEHWLLLVSILFPPLGIAIALIQAKWDTLQWRFEQFVDFIKDVWGALGPIISMPFEAAWMIIEPLIGTMVDFFNAAKDFASNFGIGSSAGVGEERFNRDVQVMGRNLLVPAGATGGVVTMGGAMLVGERGPELARFPRGARIDPLPSPALDEIDLGSTFDGVNEIHLYVDGREIAYANHRHVQKKVARK